MKQALGAIILTIIIGIIAYTGFCTYQRYCRPKPITAKIGLIAPLTGENFRYGLGLERGILLAQKDLGLHQVEIVSQDTQCNPDHIAQAMKKLIEEEKVIAIIGDVCSGATLEALRYTNRNQIVLISPASTSPQLSNVGPYFFRTVPSDLLQGDFAAKLVFSRGYKKLAIIYSNEPYGEDFKGILSQKFTDLGGQVVAIQFFSLGDINLRDQLNEIKRSQPDAVYIISNSLISSAAIVVQSDELGLNAQLFGSEALKDQDLLNNAGSSAEHLIISSIGEGTPEFRRKYQLSYQTEPIVFSAQAYDAFYALGLALKQGAKTSNQIADFLRSTAFDGASGRIEFQANTGDLENSDYSIYEVRNGQFFLAGIEPLL